MKWFKTITFTQNFLFLLLLTSVACDKPTDYKVKHLVIIGVDAMSPNGILNSKTPVMDEMMAKGAYTLNARGVLPTSSSTNWASMVSGCEPPATTTRPGLAS